MTYKFFHINKYDQIHYTGSLKKNTGILQSYKKLILKCIEIILVSKCKERIKFFIHSQDGFASSSL